MSNLFNISVKPEIAAAVAKINANTALLDLVRGTDVVNLSSAIANNSTALSTIDNIVDAIKLKTDATPQKVRGNFNYAYLQTINMELQTVLNIEGSGKVQCISIYLKNETDGFQVNLTVDGETFPPYYQEGDVGHHSLQLLASGKTLSMGIVNEYPNIDIEFHTSLLIEFRATRVIEDDVSCSVTYFLDGV